MATLTDIWRYPIKGHGRERLTSTPVIKGRALPFDRKWALAHDAAKITDGWAAPRNFINTARVAALMPLEAQLDEASARLTLTHPQIGTLEFAPDVTDDQEKFLSWIAPLMPANRAQPKALYAKDGIDLTDSDFPSISIASHATLRAIGQKFGREIEPERFRINLWLDEGLAPWEEFDWIGETITLGDVSFKVEERIERCTSPMANPVSGQRDIDMLRGLDDDWGHHDFGIRVTALQNGQLAQGAVLGS